MAGREGPDEFVFDRKDGRDVIADVGFDIDTPSSTAAAPAGSGTRGRAAATPASTSATP